MELRSARQSRLLLSEASDLADLIEEALGSSQAMVRRTVKIGPALKPSYLGVSVSPMTRADGAVGAVVCLFTDLTAVVELEEQLRLKEALARLGELTAGLAHEFRNGLATIHGYGRLLDPAALPESQRACVEGIRNETTALGEVVTNFLRFAKPDPLALQPVDLRSVIARSIEDVPRGVECVSLQGAFGKVQGDDVLLRQAFSNLVRNGIEACAGTSVTPRVVVSGTVEGGSVRVTVDDNGPGIPPESLERVFQPFVTTKANGNGSGTGHRPEGDRVAQRPGQRRESTRAAEPSSRSSCRSRRRIVESRRARSRLAIAEAAIISTAARSASRKHQRLRQSKPTVDAATRLALVAVMSLADRHAARAQDWLFAHRNA